MASSTSAPHSLVLVCTHGLQFYIPAVCALVAGSMLLVWLARMLTRLTSVNGIAILMTVQVLEGAATGLRSEALHGGAWGPLLLALAIGGVLAWCVLRWRSVTPLLDARGGIVETELQIPLCAAGGAPLVIGALLLEQIRLLGRGAHYRELSALLGATRFPYIATLAATSIGMTFVWLHWFKLPEHAFVGIRSPGLYLPGVRPGAETESRLRALWRGPTLRGALLLAPLGVAMPLAMRLDRTPEAIRWIVPGASLLFFVALVLDGRSALATVAPLVRRVTADTPVVASKDGRCPSCSTDVVEGFAVCWSCGRAVAPIAPLPAPVVLPESPPEGGAPVTIARLAHPIDAELARLKLEAVGIPVRLLDRHVIFANWFLGVAVGGIRVQVPEECAKVARDPLFPTEPEEPARA